MRWAPKVHLKKKLEIKSAQTQKQENIFFLGLFFLENEKEFNFKEKKSGKKKNKFQKKKILQCLWLFQKI